MLTLIDAHVHFRACFDPAHVLDRAAENFASAAARGGSPSGFVGVLMLTESAKENGFAELSSAGIAGAWRIEPSGESRALLATRGDSTVVIVAGQQVDTAEKLEVSILGTEQPVADGTPIEAVLDAPPEPDVLMVVPWSPGKWFFSRGRLLTRLIDERAPDGFFLGDNGGRPVVWPTPRHIRRGIGRGMRVLPGSDPLPYPSEARRTASFGLRFAGDPDRSRPATWVLDRLRDPETSIERYGRLTDPLSFLWKEIGMQWTRGRRKRAAAAEATPVGERS